MKMATKSNQDIERYYFDMFRRNYQLPEGTIVHRDKPDVILKGERKIGIEITNFFLENGAFPESEQVQRKARKVVVSEAQRIYLASDGKNIELSFSFDKLVPIRDKAKLANSVAKVAKNIDGHRPGLIPRDIFKGLPELASVYVSDEEYKDPVWKVIQVYSGQYMSMPNLHSIVSIKEAKSTSYQHCDAYWLVVVVDSFDRAQDQKIRINDFEKITSIVFEKVFIYITHFDQILEAK